MRNVEFQVPAFGLQILLRSDLQLRFTLSYVSLSAGLLIPLNFRPSSIRFLGESYLPRELVPITGSLRLLDPVEVFSFHNLLTFRACAPSRRSRRARLER